MSETLSSIIRIALEIVQLKKNKKHSGLATIVYFLSLISFFNDIKTFLYS